MQSIYLYVLWAKHENTGEKWGCISIYPAINDDKAAVVARQITSRLEGTGLYGYRLRRITPREAGYFGFETNTRRSESK